MEKLSKYCMICFPKLKLIKVNGVLYEWITGEVGMNQGGPNSPNLFRKFLADLVSYFELKFGIVISDNHILMHLLWADDLILVSDSADGLQTQLDGLFNFCKDSHMIVNETKTKIVLFGNVKMEHVHFIITTKSLR